jgi:hypothetical protein
LGDVCEEPRWPAMEGDAILRQPILEADDTYDHMLGRLQRIILGECDEKLTAVLSTNSKVATTATGLLMSRMRCL